MIPFLPFGPLPVPDVTCEPGTTQPAFAPNCLPGLMTPRKTLRLSIDSTLPYVSYDCADIL